MNDSSPDEDGDFTTDGRFVLTEAMKRELDRRIAESDANPGSGIPFEVVQAEVKEKLRQMRIRRLSDPNQ